MAEAERITDPSLLQESSIVTKLSSLTINASKQPPESALQPPPQVKLVLLQPLANAEMLESCHDSSLNQGLKSDGSVYTMPKYEGLDIRPLSKAWRGALMKVPPITHLTFDLSLPKEVENTKGSFRKVHWDTDMPRDGGVAVNAQRVMTLVITIATEIRMRAAGDVRFEVTYGENDGASLKAMTLLKKQLLALTEYKAPEKNKGVEHKDEVE